jgi:hypothetical protein
VLAHAGRLLFMRNGRIEADGLPAALVARAESFGVRSPRAAHLGVEALTWLN